MEKQPLLLTEPIGKFVIQLEESTRVTDNADKDIFFIEPSINVLRRSTSKRHHLVFGRRGSGKSSLLLKTKEEISKEHIGIYIDVESTSYNDYPDILTFILIKILKELQNTLPPKKFFSLPITSHNHLKREIKQYISKLNNLLMSEDNTEYEINIKSKNETNLTLGQNQTILGTGVQSKNQLDEEQKRSFKISKSKELDKQIFQIIDMIQKVQQTLNKHIFIFIDDLYHIERESQPLLLGFLHKIVKNNNIWLKVGTVRFRTQWYKAGKKPLGMKLGDDASEIDLDLTLEQMNTTKSFLRKLASKLLSRTDLNLNIDEIINGNALMRLIIASGGVSRDFINILRLSMLNAQERLRQNSSHPKGSKISVEDVNHASANFAETKKDEFIKDSQEDTDKLQSKFSQIRTFCLQTANSNCFLLPKKNYDTLMDELIDLKLIHRIQKQVTVSKRAGKIYQGLMLDLGEYANRRMIQGFNNIKFWERGEEEKLRRVGLILE